MKIYQSLALISCSVLLAGCSLTGSPEATPTPAPTAVPTSIPSPSPSPTVAAMMLKDLSTSGIVGTWKLQTVSIPSAEAKVAQQSPDVQQQYKTQIQTMVEKTSAEFLPDGTFTLHAQDSDTKGTWKITADQKTLVTTVKQEDGTEKNEDIIVENLTAQELKMHSKIEDETGAQTDMVLTFAKQS